MTSHLSQRMILVCFLHLICGLGLTFSHRCGITGSTITCGGDGILIPPPNLPHRVTMPASSTLPPSQFDPLAHHNCPRGNGRPVLPYGRLPSVTNLKGLRDDNERPTGPKTGGPKEGWDRRLIRKARETSKATTGRLRKIGKTT